MSAYVIGQSGARLEHDRTFLLLVSLGLLLVAVVLNIIGLNVGKWLQNAGGAGTYLPLLMLVGVAGLLWARHGSVTHFSPGNVWPTWNWDTVNFWSRSEEHTSELQSRSDLVCRLLLEKKKKKKEN